MTAAAGPVVVRMWEARVAPERLDAALAWLLAVADDAAALGLAPEVCRSADRLVLTTRRTSGAAGWEEPAAPAGLLERAHAWEFERVERSR